MVDDEKGNRRSTEQSLLVPAGIMKPWFLLKAVWKGNRCTSNASSSNPKRWYCNLLGLPIMKKLDMQTWSSLRLQQVKQKKICRKDQIPAEFKEMCVRNSEWGCNRAGIKSSLFKFLSAYRNKYIAFYVRSVTFLAVWIWGWEKWKINQNHYPPVHLCSAARERDGARRIHQSL